MSTQQYLKPAFFLTARRGRLIWLQKQICLYESLWENISTYLLTHSLENHFTVKFMVPCASFKSYLIIQSVHFVIYGSTKNEKDNKTGYNLGIVPF